MRVTYRPLGHDWPGERTPAYDRDSGYAFKASWQATLDLLDKELRQLEADSVVFQIDVRESDIRLDGLPSSRAVASTPGVIISFESKHGPLRYSCDQFRDWHINVRAIALGLESLRRVERYGITRKGEQYAGWKALPSGSGELSGVQCQFANWREAATFILKLAGRTDSLDHAALGDKRYRDELFRRAAMKAHPDHGGTRADWDSLGEARRVWESGLQ